jgi:hypothetical protein
VSSQGNNSNSTQETDFVDESQNVSEQHLNREQSINDQNYYQ